MIVTDWSLTLFLLLLLSSQASVFAWITYHGSQTPRLVATFAAQSDETGNPVDNESILTREERGTKRNKYGQFSKVDQRSQDPLEELIAESETKLRELQAAKSKNSGSRRKQSAVAVGLSSTPAEIQFPNNKLIDPYDPTTFGYIELGTILAPHGVHGLVKISAVTDFPQRLCSPGVRHLKTPNKRAPRKILLVEGRKAVGDEYLIKLEGINDREAANQLRGCMLYARQEDKLNDFANDEYLLSDLVGLDVFLEVDYQDESGLQNGDSLGGKRVGTVCGIVLGREMSSAPDLAHDMLEIVLPRGQGGVGAPKDEFVLVPFVPQIVPRVDLASRSVYISPPGGLLDLTYLREEKVQIKGYLPSSEDRARQ